MTPDETDLRTSLAAEAESIEVTGDLASAAIHRARRQRQRHAVYGAAAAAVAIAVAAPTVWSTLHPGQASVPATSPSAGGSSTVPPAPSLTGAPTSAPNRASDVPAAAPSATATFGLVTGTTPVGYAAGGLFHDGDRSVPLPVSNGIDYVARLAGGGVLLRAPQQGRAVTVWFLDTSGAVVRSFPGFADLRVNASGSRVVTVNLTGTIELRDARGAVLAALRTGDPNVTTSGMLGSTVYYTTIRPGGGATTHVWDTARPAADAATIPGRIVAVDDRRSLAILRPDRPAGSRTSCYAIYDLATRSAGRPRCGELAPTHFAGNGRLVVGPTDGLAESGTLATGQQGARRFGLARVDDGAVVLRVETTRAGWGPSWSGADTEDAIVLTLADQSVPTRQALVVCEVSTRACRVTVAALPIETPSSEAAPWPIVLSAN